MLVDFAGWELASPASEKRHACRSDVGLDLLTRPDVSARFRARVEDMGCASVTREERQATKQIFAKRNDRFNLLQAA